MMGPDPDERRRSAERFGHWAETAAAWLLRFKGYRIIARRARTPQGEIDLIAARGRVIAFVEVKARPSRDEALEAVTPRQAKRIVAAARAWLAGNGNGTERDCRFDIITVSPYLWPKHLANAFDENLW
ncbi:MAG: YraN family protein [Rhizobiales bacterium]|nr:YraN family protein [Hyphomicrobiales bacterium]